MRRLLALSLLVCACGDDAPPSGKLTWTIAADDLDGAVLSFWGTSASSVFAVGGTLETGGGTALVLHWDGAAWTRMNVTAPTLWWLHGFGDTDVWAVGELGTVLHFDGQSWQTVDSGHTWTLWGIWGVTPDAMWAVGGSVTGSPPGVVRRWDGATWSDAAGVDTSSGLLFKVWGTAADDCDVVGDHGTLLHWDGTSWQKEPVPTQERLITVRGREATDIYAVGGLSLGVILHGDGTSWTPIDAGEIGGLMGVWTAPSQPVLVTGYSGLVLLGDGRGWHMQDPVTDRDLHATWGDGKGQLLAGGGYLFQGGPKRGVILSAHTQ